MWQGFTGWHALIILVVILLLFGAPKLPALARSLGQSMKILKSEVRSDKADADTVDDDGDTPRANRSADVPSADAHPKKAAGGTDSGTVS
ncbi:twin-arginine translocase TatA/TatE family subunit [Agromyces silvae]|uniref:twin-arginine translocase TatA/TatE family subunit n=1 Tax=Agromyces silvae TaxID=3388266 RepID=UPI00280A715C|nr:twin-arginine translocase TatA/TatE family subunit [Agromyces protaetiae]